MDLVTHVIKGRLPVNGGLLTLNEMKEAASNCMSQFPVDLTYTQLLQALAAGYGFGSYECMLRVADSHGMIKDLPVFSPEACMSRANRLANPVATAIDAGAIKMVIAELVTAWTQQASDEEAGQWKPWSEYLMTNLEVMFRLPEYMDVPTMRLEDYYFELGSFNAADTAIRYLSEINFEPNKRRYSPMYHGMSLFLLTKMPKTCTMLLGLTNADGTFSDRFALVTLDDLEVKSIAVFDGLTTESLTYAYR